MKRKTGKAFNLIFTSVMLQALLLTANVMTVSASSTTDTAQPPIISEDCSLEITYSSEETVFAGEDICLWHVADLTEDATYELSGSFAGYPVEITGTASQDEWDETTITLNSFILKDDIDPDYAGTTDENGKVLFESLRSGIYLVSDVRTEQDGDFYVFESFMAAVPGVGEDGAWNINISAKPKLSIDKPSKGEVEYQVVKVWNDGSDADKLRAKNVNINIYKDDVLAETVTLGSENDWTYSWKTIDDGSVWKVAEEDIPDGYTVGINKKGDTYTITNTHTVNPPDDTPDSNPSTGDSSNVLLYVILIAAAGIILAIMGIILARRSNKR